MAAVGPLLTYVGEICCAATIVFGCTRHGDVGDGKVSYLGDDGSITPPVVGVGPKVIYATQMCSDALQ